MIQTHQVLSNLDLLYSTLDDPEAWQLWLTDACDLLRCDGGNVVVTSHAGQPSPLFVENALTPDQNREYLETYSRIDAQREMLASAETGRAMAMSQLPPATQAAYFESEFFQEFAKNSCLYMSMGGVFLRDDRRVGNTGFHRRRLERFLPDEIAFAETLNAHVRRAFTQADYLTLLEDAVSILGDGANAIYLLDDDLRVQYANGAAGRLARDGRLDVSNQRIQHPNRPAQARLNAALSACLSDPVPGSTCEIVLATQGRVTPLIISIARNQRRRAFEQAQGMKTALIVTVHDLAAASDLNPPVLRRVFGLTSRELEICEHLLADLPLKSIADVLGITYQTARTHVKSINRKLGVRSQAELIRHLMMLRP